jgi:hypothetical protein
VQKGLFLTLLILCVSFTACNMSDSREELSGDYFYRNEGRDVKDILSHAPNRENIYSNVIGYNYNSDFIVAMQQPNFEQYKSMVGFELRDDLKKYPTNSAKDIIESERQADSLLKNDPKYKLIFAHKINYWIIVHKQNKLMGPFIKEDYIQKRKELKVPKNIEVNVD